ncbi:MAG: PP2C family protein-serine/threonine phosphatase [Ignavibacteriaceae bacterium]
MIDSENIKVKRNLTALVEFSRIINSSLDLDFILNNVLLTCMGKFFATKGLIALKIDGAIVPKSFKGFSVDVINKFPKLKSGEDLLDDDSFKKFLTANHIITVEKISSSRECLGIVCLGEKLNKNPFTGDDIEFLRTILNISSSAIQNSMTIDELKRVNRSLDRRIQRLNSLFELSKEFGMFSESTKVARLLVYSVIGQFLVSKFAVITFHSNEIKILESKFDEKELLQLLENYNFSAYENSVTKNEITVNFPLLEILGVELIVPMQLQGETKGLILLGKRINNHSYTETDIEFIYSIGSLAIISLENRRLFKEALAKQKLEEELEIARGIQKNLLPHSIPKFKSFDIAAVNISSQHVGGDYYDIITLDENNFCVAIGDVSGKGVPAALLMANIQAFLRIICKQGMDLSEATGIINDLITSNTSDGKFITFFWGMLNDEKKTIEYVNAGHNLPLLIRNGKIHKLDKGGIILGVMKTFTPYISESLHLKKNDVIILFTDGVTEAKSIDDEEFSDEKLEILSLKFANLSAEEILDNIKFEVQSFAKGALQSDDITMLVIKVI